jgi:hypothetical protein
MNYEYNTKADYATMSESCAAEPPRTFSSLNGITDRLRETAARLDRMLDRFSPQPKECSDTISGRIGGAPYAQSVDEIYGEIKRIDNLLGQLERHV